MPGTANRLTQVTQGSLTTQFAYNGDGVRTRKTVGGHATQYVLDLAATLPVASATRRPRISTGWTS
jgi:YD repeat-containing protein